MATKHTNLGRFAKAALERSFKLTRNDIGDDARLSKFGMTFATRSYEAADMGHFCIMRMKAFGGLMKMETVIFVPSCADAPLMNVDWVSAFGKETLIVEFYDTQLEPWPEKLQAEYKRVALRDADLEDRATEPHWYDKIRYSCSYNKSGKGLTERFNRTAEAYIGIYCAQLSEVPGCDSEDREAKNAKIEEFATELYRHGGQAVNMITKLFGEETAKRVIVEHMYGVNMS